MSAGREKHMAGFDMRRITMSVPWNILLLTIGGTLFSFGLKAIAVPHEFVSGGLFGTAMLIFYSTDLLSVAFWYLLVNIPILAVGWFFLSKTFFFYSLYGMLATAVSTQLITATVAIQDPVLAAVAAGSVCGIGLAIMLRTRGSDGGLTIISMILHQKYNIKVGGFGFAFNILVFFAAMLSMPIDKVLYSIMMVYIYSGIVDYSMNIVNQRKMVIIISDHSETMAKEILEKLHRGVTFLYAKGAYTNKERHVILSVVQNYQLKRLEELVYNHDPNAFLIIENTYNVLGRGFGTRKTY